MGNLVKGKMTGEDLAASPSIGRGKGKIIKIPLGSASAVLPLSAKVECF